MSFTGAGPLGSYAWGTSTTEALQAQYKEIKDKYTELQSLLKNNDNNKNNNKNDFPAQSFPELGSKLRPDTKILNLNSENALSVWPAAVFTANEIETLPSDKRAAIAYRKKEFSDQPKDIVDATNEFRNAALHSLQKRHASIEALSADKREVIHKAAEWFTAIVVNIYLRELLIYPLIRDQFQGNTFYSLALDNDDRIRDILRDIRKTIYHNADSTSWYEQITQAFTLWEKEWQLEDKEWIPKLVEYLKKAQVSSLRDICASHAHPGIADPVPATSHDLNYGQQLSQMFKILSLYFSRTGSMQGIPRPRHEVDWSCTDGVEPAHRPTYDDINGHIGVPPVGSGRGIPELKGFSEPKHFSTELPPAKTGDVSTIGASLNRVITHPDAHTIQIRAQFTAENEERVHQSLDAISKAHLTKYGTIEAEQAADNAHKLVVAGERAESLNEYLRGEPHSTDTEGSYYWNEVQLAFRNHGTHWETLSQDITPLGHHYLLIHYDVQFFKSTEDNYRLKVFGCVTNPVLLTLQQVKDMGKDITFTSPMVMECSGNGRAMMKPRYNQHVPWGLQAFGCYCWTGTPLRVLIDRVGVTDDCIDIVFTGYDAGLEKEKEIRYFSHALNIHDPVLDHSWLIWMNNGVDLLPEHGYPLRLMVPAWYGNVNIKWLRSIEFIPRKFKGVYQRTYSYTKTPTDNDIAVPATELRPRAMVSPIGYPDFTTRKRTAVAGTHKFHGKCWVGGGHYRAVVLVELSLDAGKTWLPCQLEPRIGVNAWANFSLTLDLPVGMYTVVMRAMDNLGQRQQMKLDWNWASMQDDAMQIFELTVVDSLSVVE